MRNAGFIFLFALVCAACSAKAQPTFLLHKSYAERAISLDSLCKATYGDATNASSNNGDEALGYEFKISKYLVINTSQLSSPEFEATISGVIKELAAKKLYAEEADALEHLGLYTWISKKQYGIALEHYIEAYNIYSKFSPEQFPLKAEYLCEFAGAYSHFDELNYAIRYMRESLGAYTDRNKALDKTLPNSVGFCFRKMKQYDSAEYYFRKAYDQAVSQNDSTWMGIALGNIGITYFLQGRYDQAEPLIEKDVRLSIKTSNLRNAGLSLCKLAEINMFRKDYKKASSQLLSARSLTLREQHSNDLVVLNVLYPLLAKVYAAQGDKSTAYSYLDSAVVTNDSVQAEKSALILSNAQQRTDATRYDMQTEKMEMEKSVNNWMRNCLICIIILITVTALTFISWQRLKHKEQRERLLTEKKLVESFQQLTETKKQLAETELETARKQLEDFTRNLLEKNEIIEKFSSEIERLTETEGNTPAKIKNESLLQLQQQTILTDEQWDNFRQLFEKVHSGFLQRLKEKLPDLSPAETRFMALSKLNLSNKEMAGTLGISTDAVRMNRHRLRKKLGLHEDNLHELVAAI